MLDIQSRMTVSGSVSVSRLSSFLSFIYWYTWNTFFQSLDAKTTIGGLACELFFVLRIEIDDDDDDDDDDEEEFWKLGLFSFQKGFLNFTFTRCCWCPQTHEPLLCHQSRPSYRLRFRSSVIPLHFWFLHLSFFSFYFLFFLSFPINLFLNVGNSNASQFWFWLYLWFIWRSNPNKSVEIWTGLLFHFQLFGNILFVNI